MVKFFKMPKRLTINVGILSHTIYRFGRVSL